MSELDRTDDGIVDPDLRSELEALGDRMDELDALISLTESREQCSPPQLCKLYPMPKVYGQ